MLVLAGGQAWGDEREDLEVVRQTTMNLISALVKKGVLTQEVAEAMVKQAEDAARKKVAATPPAQDNVVRVPYIPETVKREIRQQIEQEVVAQAKAERWGDVNAVPEWVDRLQWTGDLRLRYQANRFPAGNAPEYYFSQGYGQNITDTTQDNQAFRMRARLGLNAKITPAISAGFQLTTGNTNNPVSTTQTLGQYENKYSLVLDRAFLKAHSDETLPWLSVSAGRIPNPWFSTDLVWNDNLNFEGAALHVDPNAQTSRQLRPFVTLGAFPLQSIERSLTVSASNKWLFGAQTGVEWIKDTNTRAKIGLAYYDYRNIHGIPNTATAPNAFDQTAPAFRQKGNTLFDISAPGVTTPLWALAADYQLLNLTAMADLNVYDPVHIILTGDYVKNIGFNRSEILARTGQDVQPQTTGYMARVAVGMPTMLLKNDWQVFLAYRHLEADAVLDAFTDSDFHLGGTNNKGFILGGQYGLDKNTWLSARWLSSNQISGLPLSIDVFQLDLNAKF
ncbi:outer membrane receptor for ferric coprogen and ferric-rhodotorulic acid [Sulfuriferula multivorans]|uniref:Outer membrane receptor for ferric coprogen and ferric-rhodotorulic acid n=2 Tax=Sulfuriferula multivorans TaxID=1559896 RepID=A0A401JBY1_9PROT|nr:outer membrane receptor for ferric coprogen and ferric-rhodotorulic acid [Sulfuriferula multivorans]